MRRYEHVEAPGPPMAVLTQTCDDDGCDRRYVLPQGDLATVVDGEWRIPAMPRSTDLDFFLERDGWRQDYLLGRWTCPSSHDEKPTETDEVAADSEEAEVLRTQEFEVPALFEDDPDPAEDEAAEPDEADDPAETVPDMAEALAGATNQAEEATS